MKTQDHEEVIELANSYTDGVWDDEKNARFEALLKADPEARRVAADFLHDHAALYCEFIDSSEFTRDDLPFHDELVAEPQKSIFKGAMLMLTMASCLAVGLYFLFQKNIPTSEPKYTQADEQVVNVKPYIKRDVAHVLRLDGQFTLNNGQILEKGSQIEAGSIIEMQEGLLELAFNQSDVHVIATAPLKMTVSSEEYLLLERGEVKLHVPPQGIGFVVETKERKITDLGTSFVVSATPNNSKVLVLDGEIAVEKSNGGEQRLMKQGEVANFQGQKTAKIKRRKLKGMPQMSFPKLGKRNNELSGQFITLDNNSNLPQQTVPPVDYLGQYFLPLVQSGFTDRSSLDSLAKGRWFGFSGIAGGQRGFANSAAVTPYPIRYGWMMWYSGKVKPPQPGRYRFWGYADNNLLVAINGNPIFDGSRFGSALREEVNVKRKNHPSFPCLNAEAGFSCGEWIEIGDEAVKIDILFGETSNPHTAGLLLIEKEGTHYPQTFWGQPKWPLFLTTKPSAKQVAEYKLLNQYLIDGIKGGFTVSRGAVWQVTE